MSIEASSGGSIAASPSRRRASRNLSPGQSEKVQAPTGGFVKRAIDLALATGAIVALSPFMALCALAVVVTTGGPAFYRHRRVGLNGAPFDCLKFRTMTGDGEASLRVYLEANPRARAEWEATRKLREDPRVTRFGQVLRHTSIDELPQLVNVIRGEMSLVGPRPVVEQELARYGARRAVYLRCRPGLTGLWQTSGRSSASYAKRVACDSYYARHWRLALDLLIIARTFVVLFGSHDAC